MTEIKHILVIGGGPAGIQAALGASHTGHRVTLVSDAALGGRAAWQTLLPSKMWLSARTEQAPVLEDMRRKFERIAGAWQRQVEIDLERAGVDVRLGTAAFLSPHEIQIVPPEGGYPDQLSADAVIIASGAVPFLPPGLQPDGERIFSPHTVWKLKELPRSMIVIGSGGPATEYVDAFSRLGIKITWITGPVGVLSALPPEAGRKIAQVMERRGTRIITGVMARQFEDSEQGIRLLTGGESYEAETAFLAIGLRPDLERLNLSAAGLKPGSTGGLATDAYGRTSAAHIYLVGDAAHPLSANISLAQGRLAGQHAAGIQVEPINIDSAVMAIYTDPQVAIVGHMADRRQGIQKVRISYQSCLRSHLAGASGDDAAADGFLEIAYTAAHPRKITGALAVCPEAAEILTPLAVAIKAGMTIEALGSVYAAHPTFSELSILAARAAAPPAQ